MKAIKLVAHRGYQKHYPENTLLSFVEAIKGGAEFIETDVQLSCDAQPVLFHDRELGGYSGLKGAIHQHPFSQLLQTPNHQPQRFGDLYSGQTITPLLDLVTLLAAHPCVHAFIEVKSCTIAAHGCDTTYQAISTLLSSVAEQCTLISFSTPFMSHARRAGWHSIGVALRHWAARHDPAIKALNAEYIFVENTMLPVQGNLEHETASTVVYEIDSPAQARLLCARGIDFIETFAIGEMHQALNCAADYIA